MILTHNWLYGLASRKNKYINNKYRKYRNNKPIKKNKGSSGT